MIKSDASAAKIGNYLALATLLISIFILIGFSTGNTLIIWFLIVVNFVAGPACLFFYLLEVKKGVFKSNNDE